MLRTLLALALFVPVLGDAATLRSVTVDRVDGVYVMRSEVWFDVGIDKIFGVLLDWDQSTKFSSVVVEARNVEPDEQGRPRYYSRNRACVWFFCKTFERHGWVAHEPLQFIEATVDPEKSDFHISNERWDFREEADGTVVIYAFRMRPKFFIPPLIGPAILKAKLKNGGVNAIQRIERLAKDYPPYED